MKDGNVRTLTLALPLPKDDELAGSPMSAFTRRSLSSGVPAAAASADAVTARRCLLKVKLCLCNCLQNDEASHQNAYQKRR